MRRSSDSIPEVVKPSSELFEDHTLDGELEAPSRCVGADDSLDNDRVTGYFDRLQQPGAALGG